MHTVGISAIIEQRTHTGDVIVLVGLDVASIAVEYIQRHFANMILELKAPVNFFYADLDVLGDQQKGQMVICLSEDKETAEKQKAYLAREGVDFTEIPEDEAISDNYGEEEYR